TVQEPTWFTTVVATGTSMS
nr:immunoglobulin heavy chain junction region [Mus musculus]